MSHDQQAQRLREIDDLLAECQRHDMTGVRVSYAQLRALRDAIAAPVPPAAVAVPDCSAIARIKAHADALASVPHNPQFRADLYALLAATPAPVAQKVPGSAYTFPGDMLDAIERLLMFCDENDEVCNGAVTRRQIQRMRFMLAAAKAQESATWTDEQVRAVHEEADRFLGEFKQKPQAKEGK